MGGIRTHSLCKSRAVSYQIVSYQAIFLFLEQKDWMERRLSMEVSSTNMWETLEQRIRSFSPPPDPFLFTKPPQRFHPSFIEREIRKQRAQSLNEVSCSCNIQDSCLPYQHQALHIPQTQRSWRHRLFSVSVQHYWNSLPPSLRQESSLTNFISQPTTFVFVNAKDCLDNSSLYLFYLCQDCTVVQHNFLITCARSVKVRNAL